MKRAFPSAIVSSDKILGLKFLWREPLFPFKDTEKIKIVGKTALRACFRDGAALQQKVRGMLDSVFG